MTTNLPQRNKFQHGPLVVILLIFGLVALVYSLTLPLGESSDDPSHFALVRFITTHHRAPTTPEERFVVGVKGDAAPFYHALVALLTQHTAVSGPEALPEVLLKPERSLPMDGRVQFKIFHTEDEAFPYKNITLAWRLAQLVSIPLGMAMIIAVYLTLGAIYPARPYLALAGAAFVAFTPRFIISSAVLNDDNMVWPLITFSLYFLVRLAQGDTRRRTLLMAGVLIGAATLVKYHSLLLLPEAILLLLVLAYRQRWGWRPLLERSGWLVLAFTLTTGWWFIYLLLRFNAIDELGPVAGVLAALGDPVLAFGVEDIVEGGGSRFAGAGWLDWLVLTFRTYWFDLESLYTGLAAQGGLPLYFAVYDLLAVLALAVIAGLVKQGWTLVRRWQTDHTLPLRLDIALLVLHFSLYLVLTIIRRVMVPLPSTAQGRHLFPAFVSITLLFLIGLEALFSRSRANPLQTDKRLAYGVGGGLLVLSLIVLPVFIWPVYYPYLPIATMRADKANISERRDVEFAPGLEFVGFDTGDAGETVPITLYWYVGQEQARDYLVRLCLTDEAGQTVTCRYGQPVDGRYPMRAWEQGYLIRDEVALPLPSCLANGSYQLSLAILPLRLDTAVATIDASLPPTEPVSLDTVSLTASNQTTEPGLALWVGQQRQDKPFELWQIRRALTAIRYLPTNDPVESLRFSPAQPTTDAVDWTAVAPSVVYPCSANLTAVTDSFILAPGIPPQLYQPVLDEGLDQDLQVRVATRDRNFTVPDEAATPLEANIGDEVELVSYAFDDSPRRPGQQINITLTWRALRTMSEGYSHTFHLLDKNVGMWSQFDRPLGRPYPNLLWTPGEVFSDTYPLDIGPRTPPGLYDIEFSVYHLVDGNFDFLPISLPDKPEPDPHYILGKVRILDRAHSQPPQQPLVANLGDQIQLTGFDLTNEQLSHDQPFQFALHWQAINPQQADYTVFTQLIGPDGQVWAQQDNQPQGGNFPTTLWAPQDPVIDRYSLSLSDGAPPGQYRLLIGMYDLSTGQRLPTFTPDGQPVPDNAIQVAVLPLD